MSDIYGPSGPKPTPAVARAPDKSEQVTRDNSKNTDTQARNQSSKGQTSDTSEAFHGRDVAVSISASAAHLQYGDKINNKIARMDADGRPIIETERATYALRPDAGLRPGDNVELEVREAGKAVKADLLVKNGKDIDPPVRLNLDVIAIHGNATQAATPGYGKQASQQATGATYAPTRQTDTVTVQQNIGVSSTQAPPTPEQAFAKTSIGQVFSASVERTSDPAAKILAAVTTPFGSFAVNPAPTAAQNSRLTLRLTSVKGPVTADILAVNGKPLETRETMTLLSAENADTVSPASAAAGPGTVSQVATNQPEKPQERPIMVRVEESADQRPVIRTAFATYLVSPADKFSPHDDVQMQIDFKAAREQMHRQGHFENISADVIRINNTVYDPPIKAQLTEIQEESPRTRSQIREYDRPDMRTPRTAYATTQQSSPAEEQAQAATDRPATTETAPQAANPSRESTVSDTSRGTEAVPTDSWQTRETTAARDSNDSAPRPDLLPRRFEAYVTAREDGQQVALQTPAGTYALPADIPFKPGDKLQVTLADQATDTAQKELSKLNVTVTAVNDKPLPEPVQLALTHGDKAAIQQESPRQPVGISPDRLQQTNAAIPTPSQVSQQIHSPYQGTVADKDLATLISSQQKTGAHQTVTFDEQGPLSAASSGQSLAQTGTPFDPLYRSHSLFAGKRRADPSGALLPPVQQRPAPISSTLSLLGSAAKLGPVVGNPTNVQDTVSAQSTARQVAASLAGTNVTQSVSAPTLPEGAVGPFVTALSLAGGGGSQAAPQPYQIVAVDVAESSVNPAQLATVTNVQSFTGAEAKNLDIPLASLLPDGKGTQTSFAKVETDKGSFLVAAEAAEKLTGQIVAVFRDDAANSAPSVTSSQASASGTPSHLPDGVYTGKVIGNDGTNAVHFTASRAAATEGIAATTPSAQTMETSVTAVHVNRAFLSPQGPMNDLRLETSAGDFVATLPGRNRPQVGESLFYWPVTAGLGAEGTPTTSQSLPVTDPVQQMVSTRSWPSLQMSYSILGDNQPSLTAMHQRTAMGGKNFTAAVLHATAQAAQGDADSYLGSVLSKALEDTAPELLERLRAELGQILGQTNDTSGEWRPILIPQDIQRDGTIPLITMLLSNDPEEQSSKNQQDDTPEEDAKQRFLIETDFSEIGPVQVEGRVGKDTMNIIIRSTGMLPTDLKAGIPTLYETALKESGFSGHIAIIDGRPFPIDAKDLLSGS
ncbi:hypothetical protein GCM10017044_16120 [Kordiimonas sediminis]|uniref:Uncharacterized protein n=1 Tax=Kordiimonas sediminis TaxID=1735581 RepID=A0A919E7X7_9PROT|nr:hypothetical protein [Kordiimonas sediminis]GHF22551.1 hypothetical protein GCM10017044_16120 [Kordiimonas sediminis]